MSSSDTPTGREHGQQRLATQERPAATEAGAMEKSERPTGDQSRTAGPNAGLRPRPTAAASLTTETGSTRIANEVVAKVAGLAARDIPGVFSLGTGLARRVGQLKSLMPGTDTTNNASQGVAVEVGEREAAIDLDLVTWYGQSIVDISDAVRRNVIGQVEGMTGLKVVEVNIQVDDIHVEGEDSSAATQRVQ